VGNCAQRVRPGNVLEKIKNRLWPRPRVVESPLRDRLAELTAMFGPFAPVFLDDGLSVPGYLVLLNLHATDEELLIVLDRIRTALDSPEAGQWRAALLHDPNWRPHLVGALAALLSSNPAPYVSPLWRAIDAGSWVTPQLVATARLVDPDFIAQAMSRVEAGCPVLEPHGLSPIERHSATGPAGTPGRSAKMLASLLALCDDSDVMEWSQRMRNEPHILALLQEDYDEAGDIAGGWLEQVRQVLSGNRN